LGEFKNIYRKRKHLSEVHQFTTASYSPVQLQTVLFKVGLSRRLN